MGEVNSSSNGPVGPIRHEAASTDDVDDAPLILTLRLAPDSFARFDTERRQHFPTERNFIPAHLTLFHHLPGERFEEICEAVANRVARQAPFPLAIRGLRFLGQGTAYVIESSALVALRSDLAALWSTQLTRQDLQTFRPHVTIQNKVPALEAKMLYEALSATFEVFEATATGILLWRYRGGPWGAAGEFAFPR